MVDEGQISNRNEEIMINYVINISPNNNKFHGQFLNEN